MLRCEFCTSRVEGLIYVHEGRPFIKVCPDCYQLINSKKSQPYSKVMKKYYQLLGYAQADGS